jgi:pre-mRNA 3'-end-processing factor FIP1
MKQRTNKIVSVSSSLKPKATTPSEDAKIPVEDEDGVFDTEKREGEEKAVGEGEEEEEEESESDEDDVQIVIGPIENHPVPFYPGRLPSTSNAVLTGPKKVDVEAVPTIGGQSLFEIDLDSADKPWRLPGADITDYFNYGFTEETWRLYCEKQRRTKTEVAQLNKIAVSQTPPAVDPLSCHLLRRYRSPSTIVDCSWFFGNANYIL